MIEVRHGIDITAGLAHVTRLDPDLARALETVGPPVRRSRDPGFAALLDILVGQQISLGAAAAIRQRLADAGPTTPETVLALGADGLRGLGFSRPKTRYALGLAAQVLERTFDIATLADLDDAAVIGQMTSVTGFGRWSAEIYLMFCLGRPDIWPAGDIALQHATAAVKGFETRPGIARMDQVAAGWRPWRSVAAHLLWRYYRVVVKGGTGARADGFE